MEAVQEPTIEKEGKKLRITKKRRRNVLMVDYKNFRYSPVEFENIFSKHAGTYPDKLSYSELWSMTEANRESFDIFGWYVSLSTNDSESFVSCFKQTVKRDDLRFYIPPTF